MKIETNYGNEDRPIDRAIERQAKMNEAKDWTEALAPPRRVAARVATVIRARRTTDEQVIDLIRLLEFALAKIDTTDRLYMLGQVDEILGHRVDD